MTATGPAYAVTLRDETLTEVESCAGYRSVRFAPLFRGVGTGSVRLPLGHRAAVKILQAVSDGTHTDHGLVIRPTGSANVAMSGFVESLNISQGGDSPPGEVTINIVDDNVILADSLAYPNPAADVSATVLSTFAAAYDVRTGPGETAFLGYIAANRGPAAGIVRRRYPWLTIPTSLGRGASGTWSARFDTLLFMGQQIGVTGNIGWRLAQDPTTPGKIRVEVWVPTVREEARFSLRSGTLASAEFVAREATVDEAIEGGTGELAARIFTRRTNAAGVRTRERLYDQTSEDDLAKLQQAGDKELIEGAAQYGFRLHPLTRPSLTPFVDYHLGDIVYGVIGDTAFPDVFTTATVQQDAASAGDGYGGAEVTITIGTTDQDETPEWQPQVQRVAAELARIKRR